MKKIISLFTIVAFIIFSLSCYSTKNMRLDADAAKENGKIKILQVVTKSGETIEFSKEQPGRIYNGSIKGTAVKVIGELDKAYIESKEVDKKGKILRMMVSIPLLEVKEVGIKELNTSQTILAVIGGIAITGVIALVFVGLYVAKYRN